MYVGIRSDLVHAFSLIHLFSIDLYGSDPELHADGAFVRVLQGSDARCLRSNVQRYGRESVIGWTQRRSIEKPICCRFSLVDISVSRSTMIDCSEARSGEELHYGMKNLNNAERV
ncbi:uncharacterized protein DS421_15g491820 [Arachis hypogaea]|nr:uncharacterized protein DS421_15g491820 [Arachis hypogaea]